MDEINLINVAVVDNDTIVNIVVWDRESDISFLGEYFVVDDQNRVCIGWTKIDGVWTAPVEVNGEIE